jgi:isoleucyl-tRNA synthetase
LLNDAVSFKNVICLGHIQDGNGQKMSKSLGNYVQPWDVLNVHGADALRWYLYTATPPGQERRFSSDLVGDVIRSFTLTLWNVYSFFITYANLDKPRALTVTAPTNDLDRWLLSELNALVREVTDAYENYDVTNATRPVEKFVEQLSTWYVRRSRRRFWKNDSDADKQTAYSTLYTALTTVAKLLAPAMPFLAEEMYQNLVRSVDETAPESIHLSEWPKVMDEFIDESLNQEMQLIMRLVSLGHSARQKANRKVRQPLASAAFSVSSPAERMAVSTYADVISDELNVKQVRLLDASTEALTHSVKPLPKQLGQKYGNKYPAIQKAILAMNPEEVAKTLQSGETLLVKAGGETYNIVSEEVEVKAMAKEGFAVAEEGAYVAALVTELTPELAQEGLAREFVRRVQDLRKAAELDVADRIEMFVEASAGLKSAIEAYKDYITSETLTSKLSFDSPPDNSSVVEDEFDGEKVKVGVRKA